MNIKTLFVTTLISLMGVTNVSANEYIRNRLVSILNDEYPLSIHHESCGQFTVNNPDNLYIKWDNNSRGMRLDTFIDTYKEVDFSVYLSLYGYTNDRCSLGFPVDTTLEVR
jgi:hypothetical protein